MPFYPSLKKRSKPLNVSRTARGKKKSVVQRKIVGWSITTILVAVAVAIISNGEKGMFRNGMSKVLSIFKRK